MTSINKFLAAQASYFKGCLHARASFEKSMIWGESDEGLDYRMEAFMKAESLGHQAHRMGISIEEVPALLKVNQWLVVRWKDGWDMADDSADMAHCPECNNGTGNPCTIHG